MRRFKSATSVLLCCLALTIQGCKDAELDGLMDEYCSCLQKNRFDPEGRYECIEMMEAMNEKYKHQPRKLNKIIEKTDECF